MRHLSLLEGFDTRYWSWVQHTSQLHFCLMQGKAEEQPSLSLSGSLFMLTAITVIVAFASE